jgi:hypothetical protein
MIIRTLLIALCLFMTASCTSKKTIANETSKSAVNTMNPAEMISNGFTFGTIEESTKEGDCLFTIRMGDAKEKAFYDPINLDDNFKKDGMEVFFKFRGLRMMNRCNKANPIEILEVQAKE